MLTLNDYEVLHLGVKLDVFLLDEAQCFVMKSE